MDLLVGFLQGCGYAALIYVSGMAGLAFADWRDRRAGRPIDRGGFGPALPGDPDY